MGLLHCDACAVPPRDLTKREGRVKTWLMLRMAPPLDRIKRDQSRVAWLRNGGACALMAIVAAACVVAYGSDARATGGAGSPPSGGSSLGETCSSGQECDSSYCVDGVCCETACTGQCEACDISPEYFPDLDADVAVGRCVPTPALEAPRGGRPPCKDTKCNGPHVCDGEERSYCNANMGWFAHSCGPEAGTPPTYYAWPEPEADCGCIVGAASSGTSAAAALTVIAVSVMRGSRMRQKRRRAGSPAAAPSSPYTTRAQ
jgi:hypothetical protein